MEFFSNKTFLKLSFSFSFVLFTGIQLFSSISTTTAALALKNLLDYEATTAYTLYMRITDTTKGWTGNITIRVRSHF